MIKKLGELGDLKMPKRIKYDNGKKFNIVDVTAIDINGLFHTGYKTTNNCSNLLNKNDIVIVSFDYTGKALGHPFYIDKDNKYVAGIDTIVMSNSRVDAEALYYYLQRDEIKKQFLKFSNVAITTSKRISIEDIKNIEVDTNILKETSKYIQTLNRVNKQLTTVYKELRTTEKLYQTTIRKIFKNLENEKLENIMNYCEITSGSTSKPKVLSENKTKECNIPVLSGINSQIGYTTKDNSPNRFILYNTRGGRVGDATYVETKSCVINKILMLKVNGINPKFLTYQLDYYKPAIVGEAYKYVSIDEFEKVKIFVPLKNVQSKIVECLDNINININQKNDYIYNLVLLRKTLINRKESIVNA